MAYRPGSVAEQDKQFRFIEALMEKGGVREAAREVGISMQTAQKWMQLPEIRDEIEQRRKQIAKSTDYNVLAAMEEAAEAMRFAQQTENANAYVKAVELRSKLQGLLIDRHDVRSQAMFQINIVGVDTQSLNPAIPVEAIAPALDSPAVLEGEVEKPLEQEPPSEPTVDDLFSSEVEP